MLNAQILVRMARLQSKRLSLTAVTRGGDPRPLPAPSTVFELNWMVMEVTRTAPLEAQYASRACCTHGCHSVSFLVAVTITSSAWRTGLSLLEAQQPPIHKKK